MKNRFLYPIMAVLAIVVSLDIASAQTIVRRTEFICYDKREDSKVDVRTNNDKYIPFNPTLQFEGEGSVRAVYEQEIEVPASWNDYNAYLHTENIGGDYTIFVNGVQITSAIDRFTPTDMHISPYLDQGTNIVAVVVVDEPYMAAIAEGMTQPQRTQFENCYIFAQRRLGIYDFNVRLLPDSLNRFAQLHLDIIADNSFSSDEVIEVGYDIYAPDGKLMEYSVNDLAMTGFTRDTMSFTPWIYHSNPNRWSPSNPKLYDLMLYIKRSGQLWEYIPLKVGFAEYGYNDNGEITAFGKPIALTEQEYNAAVDRATTEKEVRALKAKGINCLSPTHPQPKWFYDVCDKVGIYVIDCAAISSPTAADDRTMSGTSANAPWLLDDYLMRVETMYRRAQNHVCIIAFRLANNPSGNGYNLYKAYELLKSFGDSRAVIYEGADGEWNTDL
jgi:beta-galactosidase